MIRIIATTISNHTINVLSEDPPGLRVSWIANGRKLKTLSLLKIVIHRKKLDNIKAIMKAPAFGYKELLMSCLKIIVLTKKCELDEGRSFNSFFYKVRVSCHLVSIKVIPRTIIIVAPPYNFIRPP